VRELADRLPKKGITGSTENGNDLSPYTPFLRKIGNIVIGVKEIFWISF
jgi:hypothetical protein